MFMCCVLRKITTPSPTRKQGMLSRDCHPQRGPKRALREAPTGSPEDLQKGFTGAKASSKELQEGPKDETNPREMCCGLKWYWIPLTSIRVLVAVLA